MKGGIPIDADSGPPKGQTKSKCIYEIIVSPKNPSKKIPGFLPYGIQGRNPGKIFEGFWEKWSFHMYIHFDFVWPLPLCMIKDCWDLLGTEDESKARDRCTTHYQGNLKILGMILWKFDIYFLRFDNIAATKLAQKNGGQGAIQWRAKVLLLCPT